MPDRPDRPEASGSTQPRAAGTSGCRCTSRARCTTRTDLRRRVARCSTPLEERGTADDRPGRLGGAAGAAPAVPLRRRTPWCSPSAGRRSSALDFSQPAIEQARRLAEEVGLADRARFVEANVYDAPARAAGARVVRRRLHDVGDDRLAPRRRGVGSHHRVVPQAGRPALLRRRSSGRVRVRERRRGGSGCDARVPLRVRHRGPGRHRRLRSRTTRTRMRPYRTRYLGVDASDLARSSRALMDAGLRLDFFHEHYELPWRMFHELEPTDDGQWRLARREVAAARLQHRRDAGRAPLSRRSRGSAGIPPLRAPHHKGDDRLNQAVGAREFESLGQNQFAMVGVDRDQSPPAAGRAAVSEPATRRRCRARRRRPRPRSPRSGRERRVLDDVCALVDRARAVLLHPPQALPPPEVVRVVGEQRPGALRRRREDGSARRLDCQGLLDRVHSARSLDSAGIRSLLVG